MSPGRLAGLPGPGDPYDVSMSKLIRALRARTEVTPEQKFNEMVNRPVGPLIRSLSGPAILANLVSGIYNLADTFFVGMLGTSASGAIGIAFVAMTAIQAVGFCMGQGTGNAIARYLGAKNRHMACVMASTGLVISFVAGILIAVVGNAFLESLCLLAGATPTVLPYAKQFIGIVLVGAPWMASSLMLNMQLRCEGESLLSMVCIMTGAVLNIGLTPLFVFGVGLGIAGSALATVVSELAGFVLLLVLMQRVAITPLSARDVHLSGRLLHEIVNGGLPSFVRQIMLGVASTILNVAAASYGDAALAAMSIVQRVTSFGNYVQIGVGQGFQPLLGYNLGAHRYERVRQGYFYSIKVAFVAVFALGVVTCALAPQLIWAFRNDPEVVAIGVLPLRLTGFSMALAGSAMITNFMLQGSGHMWGATILGACRLGLVLGPVVIVLSAHLGLLGVQIAQPVTDVITALIAVPMARSCLADFDRDARRYTTGGRPDR